MASLRAQEASEDQKPMLYNLNYTINGDTMHIDFTISHEANLEFSLHEEDGEHIWGTQYLKSKGDHRITLNISRLDDGIRYFYNLIYKGNTYSNTFSNESY